jgi:alpha-L-fucosidase
MKIETTFKKLFLALSFLFLSLIALGQMNAHSRVQWFVDSRFGMFIHWGIYSGAEGIWKGEKLRDDNDYAEWIYYRNRIDKEEYLQLLDRFDWSSIDPEKWVILAKKAGMKYVVITAKHHDGFALWNSKASEYNIANYTNPERDIVKELAVACKKHGMKLGLYYSHWVDWEHPYGWDHTKEVYKITPEQYDQYWQEKVIPQMRELLTNYGPVSIIWFDMWINHTHSIVTKEQLVQLKTLIRQLQPECLVNSRLGLSMEEDSDVDFRTLGDNQLGSKKLDYPWQSPATVAHSWGYNALDTDWKSTTNLLEALINNVSLNGNYLLNIGPKSNGDVPSEISKRLLEMGVWLDVNGESIYKAGAFDLRKDLHDWGKITYKKDKNGIYKLFLHIFRWPYNHKLSLTGISRQPQKVYLLKDKLKTPLPFKHEEVLTEISLPALQPDPYVSVVVLEYDFKPEIVEDLVAKTIDNGYTLNYENRLSGEGDGTLRNPKRYGTVPQHVLVVDEYTIRWKIFIDKPCSMAVNASYSYQGEKPGGIITIKAGGMLLKHTPETTGLTVGEPNRKWHIDNFRSHRIGAIEFSEKGIYEIALEIVPKKNNSVKFQWLWLKME